MPKHSATALPTTKKGKKGCGCLVIGFLFLVLIGSCLPDDEEPTSAVPPFATTQAQAPSQAPSTAEPSPELTPTRDRAAEQRAAEKKAEDERKAKKAERDRERKAEQKRERARKERQAEQREQERQDREAEEERQREQEQEQEDAANTFSNCEEMNATYPHGVGRPGASDQTGGSTDPVTDFKRDAAIYELNSGSDRDDDGIACEQL